MSSDLESLLGSDVTRGANRREFLRGAVVLGAGGLLAGGASTAAGAQASSAVKRGGTLRVACTGGAATDTLDPLDWTTNPDILRANQLFDPLVTFDENAQLVLLLAEEITPNHDGTIWTIRVQPDVLFHDGRRLSAKDVLYTFSRILNPKHPTDATSTLSFFDLNSKATRIVDKRTLQIACHRPVATVVEALVTGANSSILPVGFDKKAPIGTGPFRFGSWTPGVQSSFPRWDHYWQGAPYLDAVDIIEFADDTSQINALQSGAVDAIAYFEEATSLRVVESAGFSTITTPGGFWTPITMRVDKPPFHDVRVRQALRLLIDRPQIMDVVYDGKGVLGNDLYSKWDTEYDASLPQRTQDVEQAKSLLRKAGALDYKFSIVTSDVSPGMVQTATVFAQQAKAAGVTINVNQVPSTTFFGPNYIHWVFSQDPWAYYPMWPQVAFTTLPNSPYNENHWNDPKTTSLYQQGVRTFDPKKRKEIAFEIQSILYNRGGYIIPVWAPNMSAYARHVHGLTASKNGLAFNSANFKKVWLS